MPAPQAALMKLQAKNKFRSFGLALPTDWQQPQGEQGDHYNQSFSPSEHNTPDTSNRLFIAASTNKHHVQAAKDIGDIFEQFIDGICDAICSAWQQWMSTASIASVMIMANVGTIPPGVLVGPPMMPLAFCQAPLTKPTLIPYSNAVCTAIGNAWLTWSVGYMGTLQYPPTFAACPSPMHPPTPNIPMPVGAVGSSPGEAMFAVPLMKSTMLGLLGNPTAAFAPELFESIAEAFKFMFDQWKMSTQVMNVMGFGANPLFVPPAFAPGPVVGGVGLGAPGCLV